MSHYGLEAKSFRVVIAATGLGGAAPADGFIDNKKVAQYVAAGDAAPTTVAQSLAKKRANSRYDSLVGSMSMTANMTITNHVSTGASATAAPTAFQFDILIERGGLEAIASEGLTGTAALKRLVARGIMIGRVDRTDYFDPTTSAAKGDNAGVLAARRLDVIDDVVVGALTTVLGTAEAAITVTAL